MTEQDSSLTLGDSEQSLTLLQQYLTAFLEAWDADAAPPDLWQFLPTSGGMRKITLVELIKIDLEYRWRVHQFPKPLAEYCEEFPELARDGIAPDLVYEEFHIRRQAGDAVNAEDYLQAFPNQET